MKKSRFTDSQIVAVLKEGDAGVPVAVHSSEGLARSLTWHRYGTIMQPLMECCNADYSDLEEHS
jgi:hypothetical protein